VNENKGFIDITQKPDVNDDDDVEDEQTGVDDDN
jgi:hypothetical protein